MKKISSIHLIVLVFWLFVICIDRFQKTGAGV